MKGISLMKTFLSHVVLLASLAGVAPLFTSGQATNYATEKGSRAQEDIRRLNTEEVETFLHKDPGSMARLWSDDCVVTNPLNKFVSKRQVLGMVESGLLVITSYDRQIEYVRV
jgi:hypothetical protein